MYNCAHQFSAEKTSTRGREVDLKIFEQDIFGQKMASIGDASVFETASDQAMDSIVAHGGENG